MHKHICVKAVKERVAERSGPLRSHKQTVQRPHLFRYLLRAYKAICCFASFSRCVAIAIQPPVSRLGLTWRSLPKGNCGWKSKEQTLHASAKKWKSRKSVWEPRAPGPLVQPESKVVRDCLKWTQSGYWKAEGGVPSLDPIGERCPGFRS